MNSYRITDSLTSPRGERTVVVKADSRDAAQEAYVDQCEAAGVAHGAMSIVRIG